MFAFQRAEASDSDPVKGILPPSVAARSLSSTSTEASTSRQSSMSPGTSAPVNGQSTIDAFVSLLYIGAVAVSSRDAPFVSG